MSKLKYLILDFGKVLAGPTTGHWFMTPKFLELVDREVSNEEFLEAMKEYQNYLDEKMITEDEEYDYFIDFDDIEEGYNYRIDEDTDYLYYIKNYEIKSVKPVKISSFKDDYKLDTYKLNRGYVIINNDKVYYTRYSISENSKLYKINLPIDYIMKNYNMKEYYYLKGSDFNFINEEYASEQDNEKLYLFKKFKGNI